MRGLLLVLLAAAASAQRKPVFTIDGVSPLQGGAAELLETFCPGQVEVGGEVKCRETREDSGFDCPPTAVMVTRGNFLSAKSNDVMLALHSCEPHSAHFGSSALFTRRGQAWKLLWRKPGLITDHCHRMPIRGGRQILVCEFEEGFPGVVSRAIILVDAQRDYYDDHAVFTTTEQIICAGPADVIGDPITRSYIESVQFHPQPSGDGERMVVLAQYGKAPVTAEMIKTCSVPATKPYRIEFLFDGHAYHVAPSSASVLQTFGQR